jgi:ankyrin repeat protein
VIAEMLLAKGVEVNARNKDGRTPLHYAWISNGVSAEIIPLLKRHGAQ